MTLKNIIELADTIRRHNESVTDKGPARFDSAHIESLATFCAFTNPRFLRVRWINYIKGNCTAKGKPKPHDKRHIQSP